MGIVPQKKKWEVLLIRKSMSLIICCKNIVDIIFFVRKQQLEGIVIIYIYFEIG